MYIVLFSATTLLASIFGSDIEDLMGAVETRNIVKVEKLLETADVKGKNNCGWNVLHKAAVYSNGEITRLLLSRGAREIVNDKVRLRDDAVTPLMLACYILAGNPNSKRVYEIMEALLQAGGDPNAANSDQNSPLHVVPSELEARLLISYGADVDARNNRGFTPAEAIDDDKNIGVIHALVDGKADFTIASNDGGTILHKISRKFALRSKDSIWNKELISLLAENGAPLESFNGEGETVLTQYLKNDICFGSFSEGKYSNMFFFECYYSNMVDAYFNDSFYAYMAAAGANLNARNVYGESLLHLAALNFRVGIMKWLLKNGADVRAKNAAGDPPLSAFLKQEKTNYFTNETLYFQIKAVIDALIEAGAIVEEDDEEGLETLTQFRRPRSTWSFTDAFLENLDSTGF